MFISGTGGDLRLRPNVFDSPLASHFEILAYDQRGLGQTEKPDIPYTMADYAADADGLLEPVGWNRCHIVGVSFGGMVAQELAVSYPHRVMKLVLACTSSGGAGGASYPLHELSKLPPKERAARLIELEDRRLDKAWQTGNPEQFQDMIHRRVERSMWDENESGRDVGARHQLEARIGHDTYDRLPKLRMPVFICGGRYDGIAPSRNLQALHGQIPGSRLELFEGGHTFLDQDPRAYERIIDFLQETSL